MPGNAAYPALKEFLVSFGDTNRDGKLTREEFHAYYDEVSAFIDNDKMFEEMMRKCWSVALAFKGNRFSRDMR